MRLPNRTLSIFTLSALDVLAMSSGVFVLLVVMLMPYYRMELDARSELADTQAATEAARAEVEEQRIVAAALLEAAAEAEAELRELEGGAAAMRARAVRKRAEAEAVDRQAGEAERAVSSLQATVDKRIIKELDLVFVVDASGSMGPVIRDLGQSLGGIARVLERMVPSLRVGYVAYRDYDVGSWVVRSLPLTPTAVRLGEVVAFAGSLEAAREGGATVTEAVHAGLERAAGMDWRPGAKQSIIVIGDAAAHPHEQAATLALARAFRTARPRRSVSALFVTTEAYRRFGRGDREFFAELAEAGGGPFSDHRGEMMESVLLSILDR